MSRDASMAETEANEGGKRERNKLANRAKIIDAAHQCFLKMGFEAVTVRDVIRQTGLAAGTFYNYFPDKDSLLRAVLETRLHDISQAMQALRLQASTLQEFIYNAYFALFKHIATDPTFFRLILRNEHAVRMLDRDSMMGIPMQALKRDLQQAIARGLFPAVDVEMLAAAFFGVGFELGRVLADAPHPDAEATARFATRLMVSGVTDFGVAPTGRARRPAERSLP